VADLFRTPDDGTSVMACACIVAAYEAPFPNVESKAGAPQFPLLVPTSDEAEGAAAIGEEIVRFTGAT